MAQAIEPLQDLQTLATRINESFQEVQNTQYELLNKWLRANKQTGEYLLQAKSQLPHGQWLSWLQQNCPNIPKRTAQYCMDIARNWEQVLEKLSFVKKSATFALLDSDEDDEISVREFFRIKKGDEVLDGELVEEPEDEDEGDGVALLNTSKNKAKSAGKSDDTENRYKPLVGDICRIRPSNNGRSQDEGREVEIYKVESDVLAYFRFLDDGTEGVLMNVQLELIHRPEAESDTIPVADPGKTKDQSSGKKYNLSTLDELMEFRACIREFIQSKERTLEFLDEKSVKLLRKQLPGMILIAIEPELLEKAQALIGE